MYDIHSILDVLAAKLFFGAAWQSLSSYLQLNSHFKAGGVMCVLQERHASEVYW